MGLPSRSRDAPPLSTPLSRSCAVAASADSGLAPDAEAARSARAVAHHSKAACMPCRAHNPGASVGTPVGCLACCWSVLMLPPSPADPVAHCLQQACNMLSCRMPAGYHGRVHPPAHPRCSPLLPPAVDQSRTTSAPPLTFGWVEEEVARRWARRACLPPSVACALRARHRGRHEGPQVLAGQRPQRRVANPWAAWPAGCCKERLRPRRRH